MFSKTANVGYEVCRPLYDGDIVKIEFKSFNFLFLATIPLGCRVSRRALMALLHAARSRASSGSIFTMRMSSLSMSSHLFFGRPQGRRPAESMLSAVRATDTVRPFASRGRTI